MINIRTAAEKVIALPVKVQRLITDEPYGVLVGFRLSDEELAAVGADADEWDLVSDDGRADSVPVLLGTGNDIAIKPYAFTQEEIDSGELPLGPDMEVWRSREELDEWLTDVLGMGLPD